MRRELPIPLIGDSKGKCHARTSISQVGKNHYYEKTDAEESKNESAFTDGMNPDSKATGLGRK